ncbi:acetoacetate--CoA ligase [Ramlibacter algicola]|uniref:Acetoacetate--CoA ligase n=1 Tax=Ramlibacter algicola TaxID=2795217 RepID=A0A934UPV6_9BURK|nr:acetoacetate--CoA ligase [Ramlibacter algicola]MBK0390998.1 acetoacetate--CoA ligase [Ramlibacter algicola]
MQSQLAEFTAALEQASARRFRDARDLHASSAAEYRTFWREFLAWSGPPLAIEGAAEPVCVGGDVEHARFFPSLRLSYADSLLNLRIAGANAPALTEVHADGSSRTWTRGELRDAVARLAQQLSALGVRPGDRVVAVLRNDARAAIAALAVTALGATFSSAAHDMGMQALQDRFGTQAPVLLAAHLDGGAQEPALADRVAQLARSLPSLRAVLLLDDGAWPGPGPLPRIAIDDAMARGDPAAFGWPRFPFDQPLFAMFSSGTTGRPKCIVHGAGGSLLEHVKEHRLHTDLRPGERMYFHTSCGWMMWNWQLSALASGVEIVTYDGPVDSVERLWELVARHRVHVFGTSPGYLKMGEDAGFEASRLDLSALRAVLSTGAVLHERQFHWVTRCVKDVPVQSISGGTDILGCFVLGHPGLPVRPGFAQARSLGLDVQSWNAGRPAAGIGQLVCTNPFPSRPLGFLGDADGSRFHAAYFAQNAGVWTHGDLVEFDAAGGARLHGRCDGVLNVRGTKFHPGEVVRVLTGVPGIADAMVVGREAPEPQVVALVVLAKGTELTPALAALLRQEVRQALTTAHVPDVLLEVRDLPVTHNGKYSEAAARAALEGRDVVNLTALRNPQCLDAIRRRAAPQPPAMDTASDASLAGRLCRLWAQVLGLPAVRAEDDFFALGGNSLRAARLLREVQHATGCALPLSSLLVAPTVRAQAALVEGRQAAPSPTLVQLRDGRGRPLFLVHGLSGTLMECRDLVQRLRAGVPVWGLQAVGLDGREAPLDDVRRIADGYVAQVRTVQPRGPYALAGFSFGGQVAYEMACQLAAVGERVEPLVLLDPYVRRDLPAWCDHAGRAWLAFTRLLAMTQAQRGTYVRTRWHSLRASGARRASDGLGLLAPQARVLDAMAGALERYRPPRYDGRLLLVRASGRLPGYLDPLPAWRRAAPQLVVREVRGEHLDLVGANAPVVARLLDEVLAGTRPNEADAIAPLARVNAA